MVWLQQTWAENWGLLCPFPWGELGPHLTQCRPGRGLPPYQVASCDPSNRLATIHQRHRQTRQTTVRYHRANRFTNGRPKAEQVYRQIIHQILRPVSERKETPIYPFICSLIHPSVVIAALWNTAGHYNFMLWFLSIFYLLLSFFLA